MKQKRIINCIITLLVAGLLYLGASPVFAQTKTGSDIGLYLTQEAETTDVIIEEPETDTPETKDQGGQNRKPETGDFSDHLFWLISLGSLTAAAVIGILIYKKQKEDTEKEQETNREEQK